MNKVHYLDVDIFHCQADMILDLVRRQVMQDPGRVCGPILKDESEPKNMAAEQADIVKI